MYHLKSMVFLTHLIIDELIMDDPETPDPPPPLKRQEALRGSKLLEAMNPKSASGR